MHTFQHHPIKKKGLAAGLMALTLSTSILLSACSKTTDPTRKKKKATKQTTSTTVDPSADPEPSGEETTDPSSGNAPSSGSSSSIGSTGSGQGSQTTYQVTAALWDASIPDSFECIKDDCIDTDKESYFAFYGDLNHPDYDYVIISIKSETSTEFAERFQYYISIPDYLEGKLPTRNIDDYDFAEYTRSHFGTEIDITETNYVYRDEKSGMTVQITVGDWVPRGSFQGDEILLSMHLNLPDLGLSDPPYSFEEGEHQTTVQEMPLGEYTVTPSQAHFSEHVFVTSSGGIVRFSSTATHAAASEKYLYTCDIRTMIVYIYKITDDEMQLVTSVQQNLDVITEHLPDGDSVTFYPDPDFPDHFFFVENAGGKETVMSCLNDVAVSPDGQTILYHNPIGDQLHFLKQDPTTKEITNVPFQLDVPLEGWNIQYIFLTNTSMYIRFDTYENGTTFIHVLEYDLNGKFVRELHDDAKEKLYLYSLYELGEELLVIDQGGDTLEIWDKEGKSRAKVALNDLLGFSEGEVEFPHYSFLKINDNGDFLLIFAYDNGGVLEDLVFRIHIG